MTNGASAILIIVYLAIVVLEIAAFWRVFAKAGQPGWAAIVPIYNSIVMLKIAGRPAWWFLLFFLPVVNFVVAVIMLIDLARAFGKGAGFAIGLLFLSIIFFPILGFGSAQYLGPAAPPVGSDGPRIQPAI